MNCLRVYRCGINYKYVSLPLITQNLQLTEKQKKYVLANTEKLANNLIRAKTKIKDLILCNSFRYFITITFNNNYDRFDLETLKSKVTQRIRDGRKKIFCRLDYILIPERHKNGAWHFHGVLDNGFSEFLFYNKHNYLDCELFCDLGFVNISLIQDRQKVASYITKYVTKDFAKMEKGKHLYFTSTKLIKPQLLDTIFYDNTIFDLTFFDYYDEFCFVKYDREYKNLKFLK